jgi:hypothetical protein
MIAYLLLNRDGLGRCGLGDLGRLIADDRGRLCGGGLGGSVLDVLLLAGVVLLLTDTLYEGCQPGRYAAVSLDGLDLGISG